MSMHRGRYRASAPARSLAPWLAISYGGAILASPQIEPDRSSMLGQGVSTEIRSTRSVC
jgi:hypothetical protein